MTEQQPTRKPDHKRIWLEPRGDYPDDRSWCQHDVWSGEPDYEGEPPTEYIRADIAAAEIERLRAYLQNIAALKRSMGDDLSDAVIYAKKALANA